MRNRAALLFLLLATGLGADCSGAVQDVAFVANLSGEYTYHTLICPNCCHHDFEKTAMNATVPTKQNPRAVCRNYYRCKRCGESVEGPEIPCPPGWDREYIPGQGIVVK